MREVTASENPTVDPTQQGVAIKILVPDSQGTAPSCCWVFSIHCRGVQHPFSAPALLLSFRAFGTHVRLPFFTPFVVVVFRVSYHNSWCHHRQERREDQRNSRRESSFGTSADLLHIAGARKRTVCDRQSCRCVDCVYGHPADVGIIYQATNAKIDLGQECLFQSTERPCAISGTAEACAQTVFHVACTMLQTPEKGASHPYVPGAASMGAGGMGGGGGGGPQGM